ncbi:hypothetical protein Leryth_016957 [Lithospermum erythrorhizon]|nr:hypothetical protein Leryth_016957 [Lithospermum erythrorhizon]
MKVSKHPKFQSLFTLLSGLHFFQFSFLTKSWVFDSPTHSLAQSQQPNSLRLGFVESDTLLPKSVDLVEGNGGPGAIKQVNFAQGVPVRYVKYKIDVLDESSLSYADTVIEGGELSDKVEKVTHEIKFVSTSDGGCSANSVTKFYTTEGVNLSEDEPRG